MLGAGRQDDVGDIDGMPRLCLQVTWVKTGLTTRIYNKLPGTEQQRINRRVPFGAMFARMNRRPWLVCMQPKQFWRMYHYALIGYDVERRKRKATMQGDDRLSPDQRGRRNRSRAEPA